MYLKICKMFDGEIGAESRGEFPFSIPNEKKLFENSVRMILNISTQKAAAYFDESNVRNLSETDFRAWVDSKLNLIKNDIEREFYNSYPEEGLAVPRAQIEELLKEIKSDIKDSFYDAAFELRDAEKVILKEISKEKERFNEKKKSLFVDFLGK